MTGSIKDRYSLLKDYRTVLGALVTILFPISGGWSEGLPVRRS